MTLTLAWKELREHQGVWITMVCMTVGLGLGLAKVVSLGDANIALPVAAFTILGMAGTYGIVCGSMMFAGEHEGGTLVFLDIFLGRRGLLWAGKFAIGVVLVLTQAMCVATASCPCSTSKHRTGPLRWWANPGRTGWRATRRRGQLYGAGFYPL